MAENGKRKTDAKESNAKRMKYSKFKATNRGNDDTLSSLKTIEAGWSGIWATCVRGLEAKATAQLREVLDEYAAKLYPEHVTKRTEEAKNGNPVNVKADGDDDGDDDGDEDEDEDVDIEAAIKSELKDAKAPQMQIFKTVRIDVACVLFFKVDPPMNPVALVQRICEDATAGSATKQTRHINRLTPMSLIGKATIEGIAKVAEKVLFPIFHGENVESKSFAIRPTIRNHNVLKRQEVIEKVASLVGDKHRVDLSKPDLVILVDIYTNTCGISVVDGSFEKNLKRFNLNELYDDKPNNQKGKAPKADSGDAPQEFSARPAAGAKIATPVNKRTGTDSV